MASPLTRRPVPALVSLLALLLLTSLVWWRVLTRSSGSSPAACPTPTASASLPATSAITVAVLNATKRAGIASRARSALVADGFNVPQPAGNDDPKNKVAGVGEIRFGPRGRAAAELVQYYLPGAKLVQTKDTGTAVVVALGPGYAKVAPQPDVEKALKNKHIALATPVPSGASTSPSSC